MSNAICVQGDCTTFLMYDKVGNQLVPFIKELCQEGDDYQVRNFNLDGTDYGSTPEEIFPEDVNFDKEEAAQKGRRNHLTNQCCSHRRSRSRACGRWKAKDVPTPPAVLEEFVRRMNEKAQTSVSEDNIPERSDRDE